MNPKLKLAFVISTIILLIALTSFITRKFNDWFPPHTETKVVFSDSVFSGIPALRPIKDRTIYLFEKCDFTGKRWGETITPKEADEALSKLDKMGEKK